MTQGKRQRRSFYQAFLAASWPGFVPGNQITLLQNGGAYFPAIETAIERARHEIFLETYIYQDDATGLRIAAALQRAVLRGVKVHLLIDGYGSKELPQSLLDRLRADGIQLLVFRPKISPWTLRRERLRRMHRKLVVVDREIAFVGGINIIAEGDTAAGMVPRLDFAVAVEGPLVDVIRLSAQRLWATVAWSRLHTGTVRGQALPASTFTGGEMNASLLVRDNFHHRRDIETAYLGAIREAKTEIILANAYFLPGRDFRHALVAAAGRGVRVILLLQGRSDHLLQHYASRALFGNFLAAGVEIYEYHQSFLHAKVAVVDGHWATVGSSDIDPFSLLLAREANVVVADETFAATLTASLKQTINAEGQQIPPELWEEQPAGSRVLGWLCYGLLRLMMGISGYAPEWGRNRKKRKK